MLIKATDASATLASMEAQDRGDLPTSRNLARRKAGLKGETESAYLIDFDFATSPNWAVLHDLRLVDGQRTAQIDHILINRWMEFFVLETKHFNAGVKITNDGEFLRWDPRNKTYQGMPSPLQQNERHIAVLADVVKNLSLPSRLGMRIAPAFHSLVLVAPSARIMRPDRFDTSRVIKADQLKPRIWREIDNPSPVAFLLKSAVRLVNAETVELVARQLASLHQPVNFKAAPSAAPVAPAQRAHARVEPTLGKPIASSTLLSAPAIEPEASGPICKRCQSTAGLIQYGRYGYYFKCAACDTNTALRPTCQPGHHPRLRKQRQEFFRDCPECGTQTLFHRNAAEQTQ